MAKLKMKKIEIIAMLADGQNIVERLQRRGVVELSDIKDEELIKLSTSSSIERFEKSIVLSAEALDILNSYIERKKNMLSMLDGRPGITTEEFAEKKEHSHDILMMCYDISDLSKKINDCKNTIAKLQTQIDVLSPWISLEYPQNFKGTQMTRTFIGTLQGTVTADMVSDYVNETVQNPVYCEIVGNRKEMTYLCVTCHKDDTLEVSEALRGNGFTAFNLHSSLTPKAETEELVSEIKKNEEKITEYTKKIVLYNGKQTEIEFLIDLLTMSLDKYSAIAKLATTNNTIIIMGYVPEKYIPGLLKEFENKYNASVSITEPDDDDDVPVLLQNDGFSAPVEGITEMYALPAKTDVDPNPVMAFFYYFFFGMMLSDAGYGLVMLIVTTIILSKKKVEGTLKRSLKMFQYCSITTLFWGAMFGSWFGDLPQVIAKQFFGQTIKSTALWFEPINDPVKLLLFCFAFGIAHLFTGLGVKFYMLWKDGKKLDAICDVIPVYITIIGIAPLGTRIFTKVPENLMTIGGYVAIVGVASIILTSGRSSKNIFLRLFGGIYGFYNVATGYLGDVLSYSRLLALGLATGSIANVINLLATMPSSVALKAIMLVVIGIVGHTMNMMINLLGAYVHTDRLQFVEMFSKFYEGGGRAFSPLKSNTKSFKFKKENIYE